MKGELIFKILEFISEAACDTGSFLEIFLSSSKMNYSALKNFSNNRTAPLRTTVSDRYRQDRRKYDVMLSKLKKDGLITSEGRRGVWNITKSGSKKLDHLREQIRSGFPNVEKYTSENSDSLVIISFDIPEVQKRKRNWVRRVLIELGFKMLQKSVWMGKIKAPKEFIEDLRILKLIDYLEIFSVGQSGTIRHIH